MHQYICTIRPISNVVACLCFFYNNATLVYTKAMGKIGEVKIFIFQSRYLALERGNSYGKFRQCLHESEQISPLCMIRSQSSVD